MAIVTINDSNLTAIGDAIRSKNGESTTYKPSEMAAAILSLPTGGSGNLDILTNEEKYGVITYKSSTATTALTLPDDVAFKDIKMIIGIGGDNNSATSCSNSARFVPYIYYPDMYNRTIIEGNYTCYACFGGCMAGYGSTYWQAVDYVRGYVYGYSSSPNIMDYGWITYDTDYHALRFYVSTRHSSYTDSEISSNFYSSYILCRGGAAAVFYEKNGGNA